LHLKSHASNNQDHEDTVLYFFDRGEENIQYVMVDRDILFLVFLFQS